MPEKEPREKVAHIFGWGRLWRVRRLPSLSRKSFLNPKYEPLGKLLLLLGLSFVIALILSPQPQQPLKKYQVGALAQQNVRATGDLLVEDAETTRQRQKETMANIPPVFDLDEATWGRVRERLHEALSFMRQQNLELQSYSERNPEKAPAGSKARFGAVYKEILKHKPEFDRLFGVSLPNSTFYLLAKAEFSPTLEALINQVIGQFFHQGVVGNRSIPGL